MKDLVCSLETSKKLTENGWTKETYFVWAKQFGYDPVLIQYDEMANYDVGSVEYFYPAPTLQEALDELPNFLYEQKYAFHLVIQPHYGRNYTLYYYKLFGEGAYTKCETINSNPTEAACLLWLRLRKEKLI